MRSINKRANITVDIAATAKAREIDDMAKI
jgi:hypothetical protein